MRLPAPALAALLLLVTVIFIGLGVWQLQRNDWRNDLVAERNDRLALAPAEVTALETVELDDLDYRRVHAAGDWDLDHALIIANRARSGIKGEEIVVPLLPHEGGPALLVNRGWYAEERRDEVLTALAREPAADIEGLVRYDDSLSARETQQGTWTGTAPESMASALPYEVYPWYVLEGELIDNGPPSLATAALLRQGYPPYTSHIPHMEYALTWFGIAAVLVAVAVIRFVVAPRREAAQARISPDGSPGAGDVEGSTRE